jgi:hypothetical protein
MNQLIKNRITEPEFLPAALSAAHSFLGSDAVRLEDICAAIRPPGLPTTRNHVKHTVLLARDLGLLDDDADDRIAVARHADSPSRLKSACLRALTTPSSETGADGELSGTNITAKFVAWFMQQDPLEELGTNEIGERLARDFPEARKVANETQVNTIKRWMIWLGTAEPGIRKGAIRPSITRALWHSLPDLGAPEEAPIPTEQFVHLVLDQMPWLPEGKIGREVGASLGRPEIDATTTSDVLSIALAALEHLNAITLSSADDSTGDDAPWSLGGLGDARKAIARVTVRSR